MDKDSEFVTQYIICECGDNFPNETLLNLHLANGHGDIETYPCTICPEVFASPSLLAQHSNEHKKPKKPAPSPKTTSVKSNVTQPKTPEVSVKKEQVEKNVKKPPVIKLQNLMRIDSVSLLQNLRGFSGLIKLEPPPQFQEVPVEMEEQPSEPQHPIVVKSEVEPEAEAEAETEEITEEIYYQCDVCNTIFYTEADFNIHYQATHAIKVEPTAEQTLDEHLAAGPGENELVKTEVAVETAYYYECEVCHKIFASEQYFCIHYNKVHGDMLALAEESEEHILPDAEPASQEEESEATEPDYSIEEHQKREAAAKAPEQVVYYKCDLCKILYPSEKAYNTHFDKKHGELSGVTLSGFKILEQDINNQYEPPTPAPDSFCCEFCPKTFGMRRSLQVHRKRVHADKLPQSDPLVAARAHSRSKVCDICGRAYNSNAALRYHQRRHTGEKPYPCTVCPKRFTMPMFLQIHMRTHTGEKPYECPHCPKAFTNKAALIRHDRVHTGEKPYPCPECGKFFTQSNSMKLHVSTVHLKLPAPYKSKNRRDKSEARARQLATSLPRDLQEDTIII